MTDTYDVFNKYLSRPRTAVTIAERKQPLKQPCIHKRKDFNIGTIQKLV